jgi:hypothetical protein
MSRLLARFTGLAQMIAGETTGGLDLTDQPPM